MFHVDVQERAEVSRESEQRTDAFLCLREPFVATERLVVRRERGRFDAHVHARDRTEVVALEVVVRRPARALAGERRQQLADPRGVGVGFRLDQRLLTEEITRRGRPQAPQPLEPRDGRARILTDDELLGHAEDVPPCDARLDGAAERHVLGGLDTEIEQLRDVDALEVLVDVRRDVLVAVERGKDVDEPEELRLEVGSRHRPVEHSLAPPRHPEDLRAFARTELRDAASERAHIGIARTRHWEGG